MDLIFLLKGIAIGYSVAMPVGPVGILCIQRTLQQGTLFGILFGLGVATADAIYGSIAIFGITFVSNFLIEKQYYIRLIGGIILILVGSKIMLKDNFTSPTEKLKKTNIFNDYTSAILLTLTNPLTIIIFAALLSWPWINIKIDQISYINSVMLISGIFIGSTLWFTTLSLLAGFFRTRLSKYLHWVNNLSGIIIIAFGIFALLSLIIR